MKFKKYVLRPVSIPPKLNPDSFIPYVKAPTIRGMNSIDGTFTIWSEVRKTAKSQKYAFSRVSEHSEFAALYFWGEQSFSYRMQVCKMESIEFIHIPHSFYYSQKQKYGFTYFSY